MLSLRSALENYLFTSVEVKENTNVHYWRQFILNKALPKLLYSHCLYAALQLSVNNT